MTSTRLHFHSALVGDQWCSNVEIHVDENGIITQIESDVPSSSHTTTVALPGMPNVHSHAFQRGFAGLSEYRTAANDSFWTWRKLMYAFVDGLTPEDVFVIARQLYLEMLTAGYTWVGEFHYLHHLPDGTHYPQLAEMSQAIFRAAEETGIGLCHLPVLYQRGGFRDQALAAGQRRFECDNETFLQLVSDTIAFAGDDPNRHVGVALHSLRAVSASAGNEVLSALRSKFGNLPIHIHVAEQTAELEACQAVHGKRSVEYLFEQFDVDQNWCLIHATHLTLAEAKMIADAKAVVGLCPTTEANLGDGIFLAEEFLELGGGISIGSDSHCSVDMRDELRTFEYGQRLSKRRRAILGTDQQSVGRRLYQQAAWGGAEALGINSGVIEVGRRADLTLVDAEHPAISGASGDQLLDRLIFCNAGSPVIGVVIGGRMIDLQDAAFESAKRESAASFAKLNRFST